MGENALQTFLESSRWTVGRTQYFEWFSKFEFDSISVENPELLRHLSTSRVHENTDRVMELVLVKRKVTVRGLLYVTFTVKITTTASTFKSVFMLFRMYKFCPCYVLWRLRSGCDCMSTSRQRQPQRSCQKYSARVANTAVRSDDETKLQWKSAARRWVRRWMPGGLKLHGGEPSGVCCSLDADCCWARELSTACWMLEQPKF